MRAGRLNQRITFQRRTETLDAYREDTGTWANIATVSAAVEPVNGREFFSALQVQSSITTRVVCRYSSEVSGVTTKDRILHGSDYYDIESILNVGSRNKELHFMCVQHSR
jgi:SPP1 family predicted phage head-tail adaptor